MKLCFGIDGVEETIDHVRLEASLVEETFDIIVIEICAWIECLDRDITSRSHPAFLAFAHVAFLEYGLRQSFAVIHLLHYWNALRGA